MELIFGLAVGLLGIVGAALSRQLSDEFKAWTPRIAERLVQRALRKLPPDQHERFEEEWRSHVNETPGDLGKILVAIGLLPAARKMSAQLTFGRERLWIDELVKRGFDIAVSSIFLLFTLPITLVTALLIWLDGPGPILYRQERVGKDGRTFVMLKFRTMHTLANTFDSSLEGAERGSARLSRLGEFLRETRIDEVPQIINVLRGDMSFIGPRPERPYFADKLRRHIPDYQDRSKIRPGITGLAQVNYPWGASIHDVKMKTKYDIYYLKNFNILLDIRIILRTVSVVLQPLRFDLFRSPPSKDDVEKVRKKDD
jgi:lipopolysaccharide/colanic/teichoic acid biosynthesis glycosyltransferase